jgi:hypothetical protein
MHPGFLLCDMVEDGPRPPDCVTSVERRLVFAAEHDNGLARLIFGSGADLIAGEIDGDAISLIDRWKMQRGPVD